MKSILLFSFLFVAIASFAQSPPDYVRPADTGSFTYSGALGTQMVQRFKNYSLETVVTNVAPAAATFTCVAATDICTATAHGYLTGLKVQVSNSGGALPTGLSGSTDYYVIKINANTFYLASSLVNAQAGTQIDITGAGSGTQTVTATAIAGASVKLQGSMDNSNWADLPITATGDATKSGTITTTANFFLGENSLNVNYIRAYYTLTAGQLTVSQISKVQ